MKMLSLGLVCLFASSAAIAQSDYVIKYKVSELESVQGLNDVYKRIQKVARGYCPTYLEIRSRQDVKSCVDGVVNDLVASVNHNGLTALASGEPLTTRVERSSSLVALKGE